MTLNRAILALALAASALVTAGCASAPAEVRVQGIAVPASLVEAAQKGADPRSQAEACLSLSKKLWERDVLESLRYLRRAAELRDGEGCRQYLAHAETASVNLSQRVYARLFIEGLLRKGAILTRSGEDLRGELYRQLSWAWSHTEPRSPGKAKQVQDSMAELGATSGIQLYAGESADEMKRWLQVPLAGDGPRTGDWAVFQANAWGGGSDRLLLGTNVLAFLVNSQGEPSFRGTHLWICNLGSTPVIVTSLATGLSNRELDPGREEMAPLSGADFEKDGSPTGIPVSVRYHRSTNR
jgi:hypothetical protein